MPIVEFSIFQSLLVESECETAGSSFWVWFFFWGPSGAGRLIATSLAVWRQSPLWTWLLPDEATAGRARFRGASRATTTTAGPIFCVAWRFPSPVVRRFWRPRRVLGPPEKV